MHLASSGACVRWAGTKPASRELHGFHSPHISLIPILRELATRIWEELRGLEKLERIRGKTWPTQIASARPLAASATMPFGPSGSGTVESFCSRFSEDSHSPLGGLNSNFTFSDAIQWIWGMMGTPGLDHFDLTRKFAMLTGIEPSDEPVTHWMRQLEAGQAEAARPLWEHFCQKLMDLANHKLSPQLRRTYDEDDVAVSAFHSLCRVIADRRASDLNDRVNLWRLLVTIAERKIARRLRDESRAKRNLWRTVGESCFVKLDRSGSVFDQLPSLEPTPEFAAEFADLCGSLLDSLGNDLLCDIARLKLKNYDTDQIAEQLGISRRTVQRKLLIIQGRLRTLLPHAIDAVS